MIPNILPRLSDGDVINVQGYEFTAHEVEFFPVPDLPDHEKMVFRGVCTSAPRNNDIRATGYNGGLYGGLVKRLTKV